MASLSEEAKNFESKAKINNIADLPSVSTDLQVLEDNESEFPYKVEKDNFISFTEDAFDRDIRKYFDSELASIQEEIKLIEGAI